MTVPANTLGEGIKRHRALILNRKRVISANKVTDLEKIDRWWHTASGRRTYYILGTAWRAAFVSVAQRKQVEQHLRSKGIISGD
jgi:hypothetical protein